MKNVSFASLFRSGLTKTVMVIVVQVRERLLQAAEPLFAEWVRQERALFATLRQATAELPDDERLASVSSICVV